MKIWKDITSLHSIGRCLTGKNIEKNDIINYLQFCSELIYCSEAMVSIHGYESIRKETEETCTQLKKLGVPDDFFRLVKYNDETLKDQLEVISYKVQDITARLESIFSTNLSQESTFPSDYIHKLSPSIYILNSVLFNKVSVKNYKKEIEESLLDEKYSLGIYPLLNNNHLVEDLQRKIKKEPNTNEYITLLADMRVALNQEFATSRNSFYAPAYVRSLNNRHLINDNLTALKNIQSKFQQEVHSALNFDFSLDLDVPSAIKYLLLDESLSFEGILTKSLELRDSIPWLRNKFLPKFQNFAFKSAPDDYYSILKELSLCREDIVSSFNKSGNGIFQFVDESINAMSVSHKGYSFSVKGQVAKRLLGKVRKLITGQDYTLATHILSIQASKTQDDLNSKINCLYIKTLNSKPKDKKQYL